MTDVKKKTAKKTTPKKDVVEEPVVVREIKVDRKPENDEEDRKLIVIIAIAILVIIATVIGLLVGCDKKEEEEPKKPTEDIVLPIEEKEPEKEEVVEKTTTKSNVDVIPVTKEEKKVMYGVNYYYDEGKVHHKEIEEDRVAPKYVPKGYNTCKYYADSNMTSEYTFGRVTSDTKIYLDCTTSDYTIKYVIDGTTNNPTEFTVSDYYELERPTNVNGIFVGWYLDSEYTDRITVLERTAVAYADSNNVITIYGKVMSEITVRIYDNEGKYISEEKVENVEEYRAPSGAQVCTTKNFIGWTTNSNSSKVDYESEGYTDIEGNTDLYAVCSDSQIIYSTGNAEFVVGYDDEELLAEDFNLPTPEELNFEVPTYFVPVLEATETSKNVVSDDEIELGENEVYLSTVQAGAIEGYTPELGDMVEEYQKEFVGWTEINSEDNEIVTTEEVVEELIESEDEPSEVILEAQWEVPGEETIEEPVAEETPETSAPEVIES